MKVVRKITYECSDVSQLRRQLGRSLPDGVAPEWQKGLKITVETLEATIEPDDRRGNPEGDDVVPGSLRPNPKDSGDQYGAHRLEKVEARPYGEPPEKT